MLSRYHLSHHQLGAKLLVVCACPGQVSNYLQIMPCSFDQLLVDPWSPPGFNKSYSPRVREICCYLHVNLPLGVTNEGRESVIISRTIKKISGAIAGDSNLQDRGVAH